MSRSDELRANARRLVEIARADPDPLRARSLLKTLELENPYLAEIAAEELDTAAFVLGQLATEHALYVLKRLEARVLKWAYEGAGTSADFRQLWDAVFPPARTSVILAESVRGDEADEFFAQLGELLEQGRVRLDRGLLFRSIGPAAITRAARVCLIPLRSIVQRSDVLPVLVTGHGSGDRLAFVLYHGTQQIYTCELPAGNGVAWLQIDQAPILERLGTRWSTSPLILLAGVKSRTAWEAVKPLYVDPDFRAVSGEQNLRIQVTKYRTGAWHARVLDGDGPFSGRGEFTLRDVPSAATLARVPWDPSAGFTALDFSDATLLSFEAEGSSRRCSLWLGGEPAARAAFESPAGMVTLDDAFAPGEAITARVPLTVEQTLLYWIAPRDAVPHEILDAVFVQNAPAAVENYLRAAATWRLDPACGVSCAAPLYTVRNVTSSPHHLTIRETLVPGEYELFALVLDNRGVQVARREFRVNPGPLYLRPESMDPDDRVIAEYHVPLSSAWRVMRPGDGGAPVEERVRSSAAARVYSWEVNQHQLNGHHISGPGSGDSDLPPVRLRALENSTAVQKWLCVTRPPAAFAPVDPRLLGILPPGTVLSLNDFLVHIMHNLWQYRMYCAEQTSARLFAGLMLARLGYGRFVDAPVMTALFARLRAYYDPQSGLFRVWEGFAPDERTTLKVLRNLAVCLDDADGTAVAAEARTLVQGVVGRLREQKFQQALFSACLPALFAGVTTDALPPVAAWERIWRQGLPVGAAALDPFGQGLARDGVWDDSEFDAMRLYTLLREPARAIQSTRLREESLALSPIQRITNALRISKHPARRTKRVVGPLDREATLRTILTNFRFQSGTALFGSTSATVCLVQALLALRNAGVSAAFLNRVEEPVARRPTAGAPVQWDLEPVWNRGRVARLKVSARVKKRHSDLVLSISAPAHSIVLESAGGVLSEGGRYAEIPLMDRSSVSLELLPLLRGEAKLSAAVYSMYRRDFFEAVERRVRVV